MTHPMDLSAGQEEILLEMVRRFIPGVEVWAFGSRVQGKSRPGSDLDLAVFTTPAQGPQVSDLKDALAESNLPFSVDLHVWHEIPPNFHDIIRREHVVVQPVTDPQALAGGDLEHINNVCIPE